MREHGRRDTLRLRRDVTAIVVVKTPQTIRIIYTFCFLLRLSARVIANVEISDF